MQFKQVLAVAALSQLVIAAPIAQSNNVLNDMLTGVAGAVSGTLSENGNGNQAGNDNKNNGNGNGNGNGDGAGSGNTIGNVHMKRTDEPSWSMPTVGQAGSDCSITDVLTNTGGVVTGTLSCNGNGNSAGNGNVGNGNKNGNNNGDGAGSSNTIGNVNMKRTDEPSWSVPTVGQAGSSCSISNWLTDAAGVVTGTLSCNGNGNSAGNGNMGNGNNNGNNNGQNAGSGNTIGNVSFKRSIVFERNSGSSSTPSIGMAGSDCQLSNVLQSVGGAVTGTLSCNGNGNSAGNGNKDNGNGNGNNNGVGAGSGNTIGNIGTSSKVRRQSVSAAYVNSVLSAANTGAEGVVSAALPADGSTSSINNAAGVVSNTLSGNGNGNSAGNGNTNNGNNNGNGNGANSGNNNNIGNVNALQGASVAPVIDPTINF